MRGFQACRVLFPIVLLPLALVRGGILPAHNVLDDPAFDHFYNLEYDQALAGFVADARINPESPDIQNHIAQTILFRAMFRGGMLQSQMLTRSNSFLKMPKLPMSAADCQQFSTAIDRAMAWARARLDANPKDAAALYALGVSYGLRANYNFAVRKAYLDALHDMSYARKYHNRVTRIDAAMVDAELTQGVYEYVVGSLPFGWRTLGFVGGFRGSRARGIAMLNEVATEGKINRIDAMIFLAAIYRRERRSQDAICVLKPLIPLLPRNYLLRLELAEMYGDLADHGAATEVLDEVDRLRRAHAPGYETLSAGLLNKVRDSILTDIARNGASAGG
jgi:tetratricopeptide (TPR) repeat protein